jgi:hypothetical protein
MMPQVPNTSAQCQCPKSHYRRFGSIVRFYNKGDSDSILALSLAGDNARCRLKRRQGIGGPGY